MNSRVDSNRKKRASEWFYRTLYRDEQIQPRIGKPTEAIPVEIQAMRRLESGAETWRLTREEIFLRQARQMEHYEDNYTYNRDVVRYFPTYQSLTDRELRGYFSWRAKWRHGEFEKTSLSFAFLYIYELINQIGVSDPVDGFEKLRAFSREYAAFDDGICRYTDTWLWDYVVYYRLDPVLLADRPEIEFDRHLTVLMDPEQYSDERILAAVLALSSYRLDRSKFFLKEPEVFRALASRVIKRVSAYYSTHRKQSMTEDYFGPIAMNPTDLFQGAVFDKSSRRESFDYEVDLLRSYQYRNGVWTVKQPYAPVSRSKKLGNLIKTLDSMLRESTGFGNPIQPALSTKWLIKCIEEEIQQFFQEKQIEESRKISIDFSVLPSIRRDATVTQDRLMVEEDPLFADEMKEKPGTPVTQDEKPEKEDALLSDTELRLLRCLLSDRELDWVSQEGLLLSVLVDGINEKLFDRFDDNVLILDTRPEIIEDYAENLKEMVDL